MYKDDLKVTVSIVTSNRPYILINSITNILNCSPKPDEIIIHIDGNDKVTKNILCDKFNSAQIKIINSKNQIGPGGGRNKIANAALCSIIAQFDDDSYPIDKDYFERIKKIFSLLTDDISIIDTSIFYPNQILSDENFIFYETNNFTGCGCIYRKEDFLQTAGYINLPIAYGMEEVDLALRIYASHKKIIKTSYLRVFHNTDLKHHNNPLVTAHQISNIALRVYLRYPPILYPYGVMQVMNMIFWLISKKRFKGIIRGIFQIPSQIIKYFPHRCTLSYKDILSFRKQNNKLKELKFNGLK